ncbi:PAS domain S-box protein [Streptomyces sp. M19]
MHHHMQPCRAGVSGDRFAPFQACTSAFRDRSRPPPQPSADCEDSDLLAALLDGMDAALCAFDADGTVTHWNREAERVLGWSAAEAVGRKGLAGWAVREADAPDVEARLMGAMDAAGRQVHEFALVTRRAAGCWCAPSPRRCRAPTGGPPGCTARSARCTRRSTWSGRSR